MEKDFLQSIDKLLAATTIDIVTKSNDDSSYYTSYPSKERYAQNINVNRNLLGKVKAFVIQEGIPLSQFIETVFEREIKRIETERTIVIEPIDPSTRVSYARSNTTPEHKVLSAISRLHKELNKIKQEELKYKE